jgi:hypothetical protein
LVSIGGNAYFKNWTGSAVSLEYFDIVDRIITSGGTLKMGGEIVKLVNHDSLIPITEQRIEKKYDRSEYIKENNIVLVENNNETTVDNQDQNAAIIKTKNKSLILLASKKANVTSPIHEILHEYERVLTKNEIKVLEEWSGHKFGTTEFKEAFAKGGEKFIYDGQVNGSAEVQSIFEKLSQWFKEVIEDAIAYFSDIDELNDDVKAIYASILLNDAQENNQQQKVEVEKKQISENNIISTDSFDKIRENVSNVVVTNPNLVGLQTIKSNALKKSVITDPTSEHVSGSALSNLHNVLGFSVFIETTFDILKDSTTKDMTLFVLGKFEKYIKEQKISSEIIDIETLVKEYQDGKGEEFLNTPVLRPIFEEFLKVLELNTKPEITKDPNKDTKRGDLVEKLIQLLLTSNKPIDIIFKDVKKEFEYVKFNDDELNSFLNDAKNAIIYIHNNLLKPEHKLFITLGTKYGYVADFQNSSIKGVPDGVLINTNDNTFTPLDFKSRSKEKNTLEYLKTYHSQAYIYKKVSNVDPIYIIITNKSGTVTHHQLTTDDLDYENLNSEIENKVNNYRKQQSIIAPGDNSELPTSDEESTDSSSARPKRDKGSVTRNMIFSKGETVLTDNQIEEDVKDLKKTFPELDRFIEFVKAANSNIGGRVVKTLSNVSIQLFSGANKGVKDHESWHIYTLFFVKPENRIKLYKSLRNKNIEFVDRETGIKYNTSDPNVSDILLEEFLAEEYRIFSNNVDVYDFTKFEDLAGNNQVKSVFEKFLDFLKSLYKTITRLGTNEDEIDLSIKSLFTNLNDNSFDRSSFSLSSYNDFDLHMTSRSNINGKTIGE